MKRKVVILSVLIPVFGVLFLAGCFTRNHNPAAVQPQNTQDEALLQKLVPEVRFEFFADGPSRKTGAPDAAILAVGGAAPRVTFKLILVNVGNTANPTTTFSKTVDVVNGVASCSFSSIPVRTVIGDIHIDGGARNGLADFHGALDLQPNAINTVIVDGKGAKSKIDFVANVIETVVGLTGRTDLLSKVIAGLATKINTALTNLKPTSQTYDDALNMFLNYVPVVSPIESIDQSKIAIDPRDNSRLMKDEVVVTFRVSPTIQDITAEANKLSGTVIASFPNTNTYVFRVNSNDVNTIMTTVQTMQAQAYEEVSNIEYGTNGIVEGFGLPNDPDYSNNWGLSKVKATEIWDMLPQTSVEVAVLDTGIKTDHEDLRDAIDFENSRNFTGDYEADPKRIDDGNGHGTHIAGIIAARSNNSRGTVGVAPNLKLVVIKCLDNNKFGKETNVADAINYAADLPNVRVINLSLGKSIISGINKTIPNAIERAFQNGKMVVAAAGNGNIDGGTVSPGFWARCVTVSATDENDARAPYSNHGAVIDISAPGGTVSNGIFSTWNSNGSSYEYNKGTSMAAPFVSGLAGAIFSIRPDLTPSQVEEIIKKTADPVSTEPYHEIGRGRINMAKALAEVGSAQQNQVPTIAITGPTMLDAGATGEFRATARDGVDTNGVQLDIDSLAPEISAVLASDITENGVTITWTTNEFSTSQIEYGFDSSYGTLSTLDTTMTKSHSVSLSGLSSNKTYHFKVRSKDPAGNEAVSGNYSFLTQNVAPTVSITSPANNAAFSTDNSITITAAASDPDGDIARVEFYQGAALLGSSTTSPYSYTWSNVSAGNYTLTAKAYDNSGATKISTAISIVVNLPSTVNITSPSNNTVVALGDSVTITAAATAPGGNVTKVEFYDGTTLLGQSTTSPYSLTWSNAVAGNHVLTAKAYDSFGAVKTSPSINVTVNALPAISITSPANNAILTVGDNVTITTNAADSDGSITKVEFYNGGTLLGQSTSSPYSYTWSNVQSGNYSLTAKATDNNGWSKTSAVISIIVNALPTVSITSPLNNATFTAGDNITISATAADSDGQIQRIEFFLNSSKIGEDIASPFSATFIASQPGNFALSAKATDDFGGEKISSEIAIIIKNPKAIFVAVGQEFSFAVKDDGSSWAWGRNDVGQLGNGTLSESHQPVLVSNAEGITNISGGGFHALALKSDGTVLSWGNNGNGQLGDGTNTDRSVPGLVSNLSGVIAISAGYNHSLASNSP